MAKNTTPAPLFVVQDPGFEIPARRGGGRRSEVAEEIVAAAIANPGRTVSLYDQSYSLVGTLKKRTGISVTTRSTGVKGRADLHVTYTGE